MPAILGPAPAAAFPRLRPGPSKATPDGSGGQAEFPVITLMAGKGIFSSKLFKK
jgi:hypothetical protein